MALQNVSKIEYRRLVRDRIAAKFETGKRTHRLDIIERLFRAWIGELIPLLQEINSQHDHQRIGAPPVAGLGVIRLDQCKQKRPRHDRFHLG